jgi:hypothetical protein
MVGLGTNLVCAVVNTRRNSGAVVTPTERFMGGAISCKGRAFHIQLNAKPFNAVLRLRPNARNQASIM